MLKKLMLNNRIGSTLIKNEFTTMSTLNNKYYKDVFKYYGFKDVPNQVIYPTPIIKHSKTFTKQASLPPLPVPQLNITLSKYLNAVKPLLNENEFENTKTLVEKFQNNGLGEKLQRLLYEKASKVDNWMAQWWLDKTYLEPRYGIPINVNPNLLYPRANYNNLDDQLLYATNFISAFNGYKTLIDKQQLPVEKYLDSPLCMDQYTKIVGSCRLPFRNRDKVKLYQSYLTTAKNITVIYKNRTFSLPVLDSNGENLLSRSEIFTNLKNLIKNTNETDEFGLGIMTSENRDVWADTYESLVRDETNRKNFDSIHDSLFVLCIDDTTNQQSTNQSISAAQLLHGNKTFSSNRWFDKTIQIIVSSNGISGMNFEHTLAEALPFANLSDYCLDFISKCDNSDVKYIDSQNTPLNPYNELKFNITQQTKNTILRAKQNFFNQIDNLDLYILNFEAFGKNFPKSQKISPDAFVQIAMQLAFYNLHKKWASAYESGSLRKFKLGRTDIIRSCTESTVQFLQSTTDKSVSVKERSQLLLKAIQTHNQYTKNVLNFETFDRHLMGLKLTALENNMQLPDIYNDVGFKKLCYYSLSSSQVSSKHASLCSFGPAVDDGYGVCYNILENKLMFGLSAFNSCKQTSAKTYANSLSESLIDLSKNITRQ